MYGQLVKTVTSDGLELAGFFSKGRSDVAIFHSHGTSGDFYTHEFVETEGNALVKKGYSFLTANNRGHDAYADIRKHEGGKVSWISGGGGFERFEDCLFDIKAWLDFLQKQGIKKVILQGHSLSQKGLYYQNIKKDKRVVGQIHLSPQNDAGIMYYSFGKVKYEETNRKIEIMVKEGRGNELLEKELSPVSCLTSAHMYYGYLTEKGKGTLTPYHNPSSPNWKAISQVKEPMLVVFGSEDVYMKPSVDVAVKLLKQKTKQTPDTSVILIKGATHSYLGYEKQLSRIILKWIISHYKI